MKIGVVLLLDVKFFIPLQLYIIILIFISKEKYLTYICKLWLRSLYTDSDSDTVTKRQKRCLILVLNFLYAPNEGND